MPPKPRPIRKASTATSKDAGAAHAAPSKDTTTPTSMPPPPDRLPPLGILEAEVTALSSCLQNAVVKTGQVYGLLLHRGIQQYATRPPRSLMSSLGREIVKYDQLCDAVESHLLRAIAVLQRDLAREEARIKAEEDAAAAAAAMKAVSSSAPAGPTPPGSPQSTAVEPLPEGRVRSRASGVGVTSARRQSTISLTSLSRPAFTQRLDLSASALRLNPEEMMIPSGISSPVTLAPRTAHASSLPADLVMAALGDAANRPVDIDLTVDADIDMTGPSSSNGQVRSMIPLDPALGSTADKPIELDLDIDMDIFGNGPVTNTNNTVMFGSNSLSVAAGPNQQSATDMIKPKEEGQQIDMDILHAFQTVGPSGHSDDIFASLGESAPGGVPGADAPPASLDAQKTAQSPGSILAGLTVPPPQGETGPTQQFDFDMSALFTAESSGGNQVDMMSMDDIDIFSIGVPSNESGTQNNTTSSS